MIVEKFQTTIAMAGKKVTAEYEKKCDGSEHDGVIIIKIVEAPNGRSFAISFDRSEKLKEFGKALQNIAHTIEGWYESG